MANPREAALKILLEEEKSLSAKAENKTQNAKNVNKKK